MEVTSIKHALEDCRQEALSEKFLPVFMELLFSQGFTVIDLLDAIACWVSDKPEYESCLIYLEGAIDSIKSKVNTRTNKEEDTKEVI